MRAAPSDGVVAPFGHLRIEEVEGDAVLPQILRLRALAFGRRISLAPDIHAWSDPLDVQAQHWCVFHDAGLVATARLCVFDTADGSLGASRDAWPLPIALMSHCVVDPRYRGRGHLDAMLDGARIERARQMRIATVLARPESPQRIRVLATHGFTARNRRSRIAGGGVLVLNLSPGPASAIARGHPPG